MRTLVLNFSKLVEAINFNYMNYGGFAAVETVREHYKELTDVAALKVCLDWVEHVLGAYPFNRGLHSTRRAIQSRIDSLSSTTTNK